MPPRTIDNLPIEASNRWAEDQKNLDDKLLKDGKSISSQTQVDVTVPSYASEFDILFETQKKNVPWADFAPPTKFTEQRKQVFTFQIIPSMGTDDKMEALQQKLSSFKAPDEATEKQRKIFSTLIEKFRKLNKSLVEINSRRNEYHKG